MVHMVSPYVLPEGRRFVVEVGDSLTKKTWVTGGGGRCDHCSSSGTGETGEECSRSSMTSAMVVLVVVGKKERGGPRTDTSHTKNMVMK